MKHRLIVWSVILLALAVRAGGLGAWSVTHDEAYGLWVATRPLAGVLAATARDVHPPLYYLLLHGWLALGPPGDTWARLLAALLGTALAPVLYALGRRLWDRRAGLAAALLAALSPLAVAQAREARMYPLAVLLLALAAYALLRAAGERRARWWAAYVILATLALYTHYYAALVLVVFMGYTQCPVDVLRVACYVLRSTQHAARSTHHASRIAFHALLPPFAIALLYLPWLPALLDQIGRVRAGFWIPPPSLAAVGRVAQTLAFYAVTPRPPTATLADFTVKVVGAGCMAVALLAALASGRRSAVGGRAGSMWLPLLWLVAPMALAYAVSLAGPSVFEPRYFAVCLPAFWLLAAHGVTTLPGRVLKSTALAGLALASLASLVILLTYPAYRPPDTRAAAMWLRERPRPGALVVHASQFSLRPVVWYNGGDHAGVLVDDPALPAQLAAANRIRLVVPYDVRVANGPRQADAIAAEWAAQHGLWDLRTVARFWGIHIYEWTN